MEPIAQRPSMSDYGVDGPGWSPLPWSWAAERLVANRNFWVVTASASARPHAMPVWGVWHVEEQGFAFSCSPNARKARNIAANAQVVVALDDTVECVTIEGLASGVEDVDRREVWIERYLEKYRPLSSDLSADFIRAHALFEVRPERAFGIIEREDEFATRATRWVFGD